MYGQDPDSERLAGFFDGLRAARVSVLNAARPELARFGLLVDDDACVTPGEASDPIEPLAEPEPDNPLSDQDYAEGWEDGYAAGHQRILRLLRAQLAEEDLFIADDGVVTTTDVASQLVSFFRHRAAEGSDPLTDAALHAFLDGAVSEEPGLAPSAPEPRPATAAPGPTLLSRLHGAWNMARENIDRRTAIAALTGALITATAGWIGLHSTTTETASESKRLQASPWVPPTYWDALSPSVRARFLQIDFLVFQAATTGSTPQLAQLIGNLMAVPGNGELKKYVADYVRDMERPELLPAVMCGLSPSVSPRNVRSSILRAVERVYRAQGAQAVGLQIRNDLQAYKNSNTEVDPSVERILDRCLSHLQGL